MSDMSQIRTLVETYLEEARAFRGRDGKVRSQNTMAGYREAARRFADAVEQSGLPLDQLPADFLHTHWLQLLQHRWHQPVQLRVRAFAVQNLLRWLYEHNVPIPALIPVKVQTPDTRTAMAAADGLLDVPPEESNMPQPILSDLPIVDDPMASGETLLPPMQQQMPMQMQPPQQMQMQMTPVQPRMPPANIGMPGVPQRPANQPIGMQQGRPTPKANPLAHMLPTAGYRLRVRRERDLEEPVWVGDYPAEQVVVHGAIEPFLAKVAAQKLPGVSGDVAFIVAPIGPDGREGERSRVTIAVTASAPTAAPTPMMPMHSGGGITELADMLSLQRRALEEAEGRIANQVQQQVAPQLGGFMPNPYGQQQQQQYQPMGAMPPVPSPSGGQDDIRMALFEMQRGMGLMAERVAELSNRQPEPPPQPASPQLDVLAIIDRVGGMMRSNQPTEPQKSAAGSMGEVFSMMAQAKQIFAPSNVNVDVSPLEDELKSVRAELQAVRSQAQKKDEILEFAEKMKALQSLFGGAGSLIGGSSAGKPAGSLGAAFGGLIEKVIENPEPLANAIERVLSGVAQVKGAAVQQELRKPPPPVPGQGLDPRVKKGVEALLSAEGEGAIVMTAMELVKTLNSVDSMKPVAEQIAKRLTSGNEVELVGFLQQVFARLGYGHVATAQRVQTIVSAVFKQIRAAQAAEAEQARFMQQATNATAAEPEDEEGDEEEGDTEEYDDEEGDEEVDSGEETEGDEEPEDDDFEMELDDEERTRGSRLNI